ncbi:guanylate kinase [Abditibacterium utsteinense]|uniref:Guanylate kinase n=1 Tax=Abditibacterium utsteinense TaxID=1960156 RepID=A0A2S8SRC7_9BACT|nr:guanylate kinase [Abditibacterium utsteinense]PQV63347.1 guanylate kinase [Abditibacterium utsteinense]
MSENSALGLILVISGPSGVGKDTVWKAASACLPSFERAVTCTTRERRPHEVKGRDYHFVSHAEFERMIREDELIEYAQVHGNFYGVPQKSVLDRINNSDDVVCVIDVQGALRIRRLFPNALLVFIKPPQGRETAVLEERIQGRSAVDASELATRLETASWELSQTEHYDYQIENDEIERASSELCDVIRREKAQRLGTS